MSQEIFKKLKDKLGKELKADEKLAPYSNYKIGGPAEYFFKAQTEDDIVKALKLAKELDIEVTILGAATNVLINSNGVDGLVIKIDNQQMDLKGNELYIGAGVDFQDLLKFVLEKGFGELDWAGGIPGTVGAAIYGNAGCYGSDTASNIFSVKAFNGDKIVEYKNDECKFAYRDSIFKHEKKGEVILSAIMKFQPSDDIEKSKKLVKERIADRERKHPLECPNVGSVFKNVKLNKEKAAKGEIELENPKLGELKGEAIENLPEKFLEYAAIPTAYLIELADLKGYTIGGLQVSPKHANFLVNTGTATSEHYFMLTSYIKQQIRDQYGVQLKEEVQLIGF